MAMKEKNTAPCPDEEHDSLACLLKIVVRLRADNGCPWDQKQTPQSLTRYLKEESDELIEAIFSGDSKHICEEIGDLFFILAILTTIYAEHDEFTIADSLRSINEKMIRRHPHVFAGGTAANAEELRAQWEQIKQEEKNVPKR